MEEETDTGKKLDKVSISINGLTAIFHLDSRCYVQTASRSKKLRNGAIIKHPMVFLNFENRLHKLLDGSAVPDTRRLLGLPSCVGSTIWKKNLVTIGLKRVKIFGHALNAAKYFCGR
jgi:hypothetical protein